MGSLSPPRGNIPTIFNGKVNHPYRYFINSGLWQDEYTTDVSSRWTIIDTALALSTSYPKKTVIQGMTMVSLPGGSFIMGENENSAVNPYQPTPEHKVTLDPFQMGAYEVTRIQYSQVMGTPPPAQQVRDKPAYVKHWEEAALYCNRLSRLAGFKECYDTTSWKCDFSKNGFRLPTEAEWEYAARGGRQYPFATFNGQLYHSNAAHSGLSMKQTNMVTQTYMANVSVEVRAGSYIHPPLKDVGSYPPNPFGLYDMCGNTSEICNDPYQTLYYSSSPELNPPGPDNSRIKVSEVYPDGKIIWFYNYVVRGGNNADMPLTFTRYPYGFLLEESRKLLGSEFFTEEPYNNGFRVARRP